MGTENALGRKSRSTAPAIVLIAIRAQYLLIFAALLLVQYRTRACPNSSPCSSARRAFARESGTCGV